MAQWSIDRDSPCSESSRYLAAASSYNCDLAPKAPADESFEHHIANLSVAKLFLDSDDEHEVYQDVFKDPAFQYPEAISSSSRKKVFEQGGQLKTFPEVLQTVGLPGSSSMSYPSGQVSQLGYGAQDSDDWIWQEPLGGTSLRLAGNLPSGTSKLPARSFGSKGHPELCQRPCIFLGRGQECPRGVGCSFCHLDHSLKPYHLDKSHRGLLKKLPRAAVVHAAIPLVQASMEAIAMRSEPVARQELRILRAELVAFLEAILAKELEADPHVCMKMGRKMNQAFSKLPFLSILGFAMRGSSSPDDVAEESWRQLRSRIQEVMG